MACDICGKTGTSLSDLRSAYATSDIKSICPDCEKVVNRQLSKIQTVTSRMVIDLLKRFICGMRKPAPPAPQDPPIAALAAKE